MSRYLVLLLLVGSLTTPSHAYPPQEWRFNVLLDGKPIGQHSFVLRFDPPQQELRSEADYSVKVLGFSVYRFRHAAVERWQGGCLNAIDARTDDNGESLSLKGTKTAAGLSLDGPAGKLSLPGCVMSFAYWNPAILKQPRLLNAQNGEYLPVRVTDLGSESVSLAGSKVIARRYRLDTAKFRIDLWYDTREEWLALETRTEQGRQLRYERATPPRLSSRSARRA